MGATDDLGGGAALEIHEAVVSLISDFVWKADFAGNMVEDCPKWRDFTGQSDADWLGDGWKNALHPDDREAVEDSFSQGGRIKVGCRVKHWTGDWVQMELRAKAVSASIEIGELKWVGIAQRQSTEEQLRKSEQTLGAVLESLPVGVVIADANGKVLRCNRANMELWGVPPETTSWEQYEEWVGYHPDSGEKVRPDEWAMTRAILNRETVERQYVEVERFETGERRLVINNGAPIIDTSGEIWGGVVAQLDITDHVETEDKLREQQQWFHNLAENMSQFAWMAEPNGDIFWYNRQWFDYTGTTLEEMKGWGWTAVHHPDHIDRVVEKISKCWESGEPWEDTFPLRGKDGSYRWFLSRANPIRDDDGNVLRWFGTNTDITRQREAEQSLKEADRRKDEFLATLAHELRNPLAPIRTGLEVIKMADGNPDIIEKVRSTMENQTIQLVRLIDDLLDVSRITRGKLKLQPSQFELGESIVMAVDSVAPSIESCGHRFTLDIPCDSTLVEADSCRLTQVLSNLLTNAVRYTPSGGEISLKAWIEGSDVKISVSDNGQGILPENQSKIFDMFSQEGLHAGTNAGLGIGLTLVKSLTELHGGNVVLESGGKDMGSVFTLTLPILVGDRGTNGYTSEHAAKGSDKKKLKVLVVDDNVAAAENLSLLVRLHKHEVKTVNDGESALTVAEEFRPELVLSDLGMAEMSGYEFGRRLREKDWAKDVVLVAVTGWGQEDARKKSTEAGFDNHLIKGEEPVALARIFDDVIGKI